MGRFFCIVISLALALAVSATPSSQRGSNTVVGIWRIDTADWPKSTSKAQEDFIRPWKSARIVFQKGHTYTVNWPGDPATTGTWTMRGQDIVAVAKKHGARPIRFHWDGTKLTLAVINRKHGLDRKAVFIRVKST